jgi:hypothetical protein
MPRLIEETKTDILNPLATLAGHGGKWGKRIGVTLASTQVAWPVIKKVRDHYNKQSTYTITVFGTDIIYPDLHEWLLDMLPARHRRALIAETESIFTSKPRFIASTGNYDDGVKQNKVRLRYDGSKAQTVTLDGNKIEVRVEKEDQAGMNREKLPENWRILLESIIFTTSSEAGRDAVVRWLNELTASKAAKPGPPPIMMLDRWGEHFRPRADLPVRTMESVILRKGQLEKLTEDIGRFLANEEHYGRYGRPWHRGYLFHGMAGTGKTSVVRAIGHHYKMPVYYLPLADIEKDTNLLNVLTDVPPCSILLLEDADIFQATTSRSEEQGTVTLSAMLNALDGVWTPHGLITILTTNHKDSLDPALLRKGRVDVEEEFLPLDGDQAKRLVAWYDVPKFNYKPFIGMSPADLIEELANVGS